MNTTSPPVHFPVRHAQPVPVAETLINVNPHRRGDNDAADTAFAAYVAHHGADIRRLATLLVANSHDAEDLAQLALGRALVVWRKHGALENPTAYIHRIMVNARTRAWRRKLNVLETLTDRVPDSRVQHDRTSFEDLDIVMRPLKSLPRTQRTAVVLRYYADLSVEDTAQLMGCSTGSVKAYASRGLAALRAQLPHHIPECYDSRRGGRPL